MRQWIGKWIAVAALAALAACGNGGDDDPSAVTVGADGGSVASDSGVKVIVPPGAMTQEVTIRVAQDATGAPPLPGWTQAAGPTVAITPHGAEFSEPVTVRLPMPTVTLQDNQRLFIAKAQPGGEWEVLGDTAVNNGRLEAQVRSFSYFAPVVVTYLPVPNVTVLPQPYAFSSMTLTCAGSPCANPELVRRIPMSVTVTPNGGLLPASCVNPRIGVWQGDVFNGIPIGVLLAAGSGTVFNQSFSLTLTAGVLGSNQVSFTARLVCTDAATNARSFLTGSSASLQLRGPASHPQVPQVVQFPAAIERAPGEAVTLRGVLLGGASVRSGTSYNAPSSSDQATVYLERKDPSDSVWRSVQTRSQTEANPSPLGGSSLWAFWGYDFTLGAASATDNGAQFRLRACYRLPTATAEACNIGPLATLTVVQQTVVPSFTQQPRALLVQPGQTASFSVVAGGTPAPTLKWQTRAANATGDWADVTDGSGAASANYTTPVLQLGDNGRQYRVLASNAAGSTPSETVTVSVADGLVAPVITTQPAALAVLAGSEAVFAVTASGTGPLSYQWFFGDVALSGGSGPQLKIANTSAAHRGLYSVRVSNGAGPVLSDRVALTVTDVPSGTPVAPAIATQPAAVAVTVGNTATFGVGVTGTGPFTFQWRRNEVAIAGATAAAYTIQGVTTADAGNYSVVVSNGVGDVTSRAATLGVAPALTPTPPEAPTINAQPQPMVATPGMSVVMAVGTQGSGPLAYQWSRNGTPLAGQTGAQLLIAAATAGDAGSYQVTVSNASGSVASNAATLTVIGAPAIGTQPSAVSAEVGATATFGVTATGDALRYQWLRNGEAIPGADSASYTTDVLSAADSGAVYAVVVYNGAGMVVSPGALLTVTAAPQSAYGKISAFYGHACAITASAQVYCWGKGDSGQLGDGRSADTSTPVRAAGITNAEFVAAGYTTSCAIHDGGKLSCWGDKLDDTGSAATPVFKGISDATWAAVGFYHVCYVNTRGEIWCWGSNTYGALGDGTRTSRSSPVQVKWADGTALTGAVSVAASSYSTCATLANGEVWCWGKNVSDAARTAPVRVRRLDFDGQRLDLTTQGHAVAGIDHFCANDANPTSTRPVCWGFNNGGQLGDYWVPSVMFTPNSPHDDATPTGQNEVGEQQLASGGDHSCSLNYPAGDGTNLRCWGRTYFGNGADTEVLGPTATAGLADYNLHFGAPIHAVAAGLRFTCALRSGAVLCWGDNSFGQIGNGNTTVQTVPTMTSLGAVFWTP